MKNTKYVVVFILILCSFSAKAQRKAVEKNISKINQEIRKPEDKFNQSSSITKASSSLKKSTTKNIKNSQRPGAVLYNVVQGQISRSALLGANWLAPRDDCGEIISYQVAADDKKTFQVDGSVFSEELKDEIAESKSGQRYVFSDVKLRLHDGVTIILDTIIEVKIK